MFRRAKLYLVAVAILSTLLALLLLFAPAIQIHTVRENLRCQAFSLKSMMFLGLDLARWRMLGQVQSAIDSLLDSHGEEARESARDNRWIEPTAFDREEPVIGETLLEPTRLEPNGPMTDRDHTELPVLAADQEDRWEPSVVPSEVAVRSVPSVVPSEVADRSEPLLSLSDFLAGTAQEEADGFQPERIDFAVLVAPDGSMVDRFDPDSILPGDLGSRPMVIEALTSRRSASAIQVVRGQLYLTVAMPIRGSSGRMRSLLVVGQRFLAKRFSRTVLGREANIAFFSSDGSLLSTNIHGDPQRVAADRYLARIHENGGFPREQERFSGLAFEQSDETLCALLYGPLPGVEGEDALPAAAYLLVVSTNPIPSSFAAMLLQDRNHLSLSWEFWLVCILGLVVVLLGFFLIEIDSRRYLRTLELLKVQIIDQLPEHLRVQHSPSGEPTKPSGSGQPSP
ncbi:MAG: cache domain-containing protein [Bradymonadales bacterium]|nr:cache domain-containing protein [Bradymonadales bacterium]